MRTNESIKKPAESNNTAPRGDREIDRLAKRWIELIFDHLQESKNSLLPGAISLKSLDNKYRAEPLSK
jgi:hypothetical protein